MKVLIAGAAGALGMPTAKELLRRGHDVVGVTRSRAKAAQLEEAGIKPLIADVFDPGGIAQAAADASPDGIVQMLNALPKNGPIKPAHLDGTNRLRVEGTRNLLRAAVAARVRRYVVESMIFGYGYEREEGERITEDQPFLTKSPLPEVDPALEALGSLEAQVVEASERGDVEGVVLRYGLFYGPGVGSTEFFIRMLRRRMMGLPGGGPGIASWIHVEDGATAAATALESAPSGSVFNVVDDEPASMRAFTEELAQRLGLPRPYSVPLFVTRLAGRYAAMVMTSKLRVSNEKIKRELGWSPKYPTIREGIAAMAGATDRIAS